MAGAVRTTCPYCGVGCGVVARPEPRESGSGGWRIDGDPDHPANRGRLCSKGAMLADVLDPAPRLTAPLVDGVRTPWDRATAAVADRLRRTIAAHGPESVAFYVSGQMLTEDYYVVNKLAKGFIGTPHVDTNSRLCMASTVAGHRRAFGGDVVPGCYDDLDEADLIVLVGSNLAWCHPILHRRVQAAQARGARIVVVDPRRTDTCDGADLHLPIAPGSDVALFNGLLAHLADAGALDTVWAGHHTAGLDDALAAARADAVSAAAICGLAPDVLGTFYRLFAATPRVVTVFSQGVNQSSAGSNKVNAILNVHLATGRIGRPGMGPFSVTGQPNAMGGREVGGLANQLAAHMTPDDPADVDRLRRFWQAPALKGGQGLKAVDLFDAVHDGRIKALWIIGTNPAVSLPRATRIREALDRCPLVIVSDVVADTDTARFAHILLPAAGWSEKDGTVTNSERRISRQRAFRAPVGDSRPDWRILCDVATALGHGAAFAYNHPAAIFAEHAALSAFENTGTRAFHIGGLAGLDRAAYDALAPVQWPVPANAPQGTARLFASGGFPTADGRARLLPLRHRPPREAAGRSRPLLLNTGRIRDQWHTMTRTGLSPRLTAHRPEPLLDIHPADAAAAGVADGGLAEVGNQRGRVVARVRVTDAQPPGQVFLPIHWTDAFSGAAIVSRLIDGAADPVSGQPESKNAAVRVSPLPAHRDGLLFSETPLALPDALFWNRVPEQGSNGGKVTVTTLALPPEIDHPAGLPDRAPDLQYSDTRSGAHAALWLTDERLEAALYLGPARRTVDRAWVAGRIGAEIEGTERLALLAGRAASTDTGAARGRTVCACLSVHENTIRAAMRDGATTVDAIARRTGAGTGCGSCRAEVGEILSHDRPVDHAAE